MRPKETPCINSLPQWGCRATLLWLPTAKVSVAWLLKSFPCSKGYRQRFLTAATHAHMHARAHTEQHWGEVRGEMNSFQQFSHCPLFEPHEEPPSCHPPIDISSICSTLLSPHGARGFLWDVTPSLPALPSTSTAVSWRFIRNALYFKKMTNYRCLVKTKTWKGIFL